MDMDLVDCKNAEFAPGGVSALICKVDGGPCAYQKYCGIVGHAINTYRANECKEFNYKESVK